MAAAASHASLTDVMWSHTASIYDAILAHPFIEGLTSGELDRSAFEFYTVQDALYLKDYARSLSLAAAQGAGRRQYHSLQRARQGLSRGRAGHAGALSSTSSACRRNRCGRPPRRPCARRTRAICCRWPTAGPTTRSWPSYSPATGSTGKWARRWPRRDRRIPMYQQWIDTYAGEQFAECVVAVLEITNRIAEGLPTEDREAMLRHYITTSRYEWMFWNMGYPEGRKRGRCEVVVSTVSNAHFAWVQRFLYHLAPRGTAGFVPASNSMSSNQSVEGVIRKNIIEAGPVDCIIALPDQLFRSIQIPACLWFLSRGRL